MVSAFILSSRVEAALTAEQGAPAHVRNERGECDQSENDVKEVDQFVLGVNRAFCRRAVRIK